MNNCPACSQPVAPNDLTCPKCGISLHPGTATAGPASGAGEGKSAAAIVAIVVVGGVLLAACLGVLGMGFYFVRMSPVPVSPPLPLGDETESDIDLSDPPRYEPPEKNPDDQP